MNFGSYYDTAVEHIRIIISLSFDLLAQCASCNCLFFLRAKCPILLLSCMISYFPIRTTAALYLELLQQNITPSVLIARAAYDISSANFVIFMSVQMQGHQVLFRIRTTTWGYNWRPRKIKNTFRIRSRIPNIRMQMDYSVRKQQTKEKIQFQTWKKEQIMKLIKFNC